MSKKGFRFEVIKNAEWEDKGDLREETNIFFVGEKPHMLNWKKTVDDELRARIQVMSPDLQTEEKRLKFFIVKSSSKKTKMNFRHLGEGLVLVTEDDHEKLRFFVLDIEKNPAEVDFEPVLGFDKNFCSVADEVDEKFSGIAIESGALFLYDFDGYIESLVESKRNLKLQTSLGVHEPGQEPE